jgi:hypothetical protein
MIKKYETQRADPKEPARRAANESNRSVLRAQSCANPDRGGRLLFSVNRRLYALIAIAVLVLDFLAFQVIGQPGDPAKTTTPVKPDPKKVE